MSLKVVTRRDFIKEGTAAAIAGTLYMNLPRKLFGNSETKSRVVLIRNKNVLDDLNRAKSTVVEQMLDEAVMALLDESSPNEAWRRLIEPEDVVGIKTNVWHYLPTPPEINDYLKNKVLEVGVPEDKISVRDRGLLRDSIFMNSTALINARPLRTHYWSGVGSLLKNYIMFVNRPSDYHPDTCADLAKIWKLPETEGKTRLNILVMFTPLFHGMGPHHFNPKYIWRYNGLLVGTDPVAVDAIGVRILQAKRNRYFGEDRPLNPPAKHIFLADTRHHLGTADPAKIELIKIGWKEDILI